MTGFTKFDPRAFLEKNRNATITEGEDAATPAADPEAPPPCPSQEPVPDMDSTCDAGPTNPDSDVAADPSWPTCTSAKPAKPAKVDGNGDPTGRSRSASMRT
jgi:hypothetical protein